MTSKIFRTSVILITLLTLCAAPALQAFSFSDRISQMKEACGCGCCFSNTEESSCPVKAQSAEKACACEVGQQIPFNSKPFETVAPSQNITDISLQKCDVIVSQTPDCEQSFNSVVFTIPSKTHPPLYILNASLLI